MTNFNIKNMIISFISSHLDIVLYNRPEKHQQ